jgi:uncharacterized damage-inducible protein DinB
MLGGLSDAWVHGNYGDKTFSPFDVVGHLIHGERTDWMPRARIILEHGESRTFDAFDRYAMFEENEGKTIGDLLAAFESLRRANVDQLRALNLSAKQLELKGTHPRLGGVTMKELIAMWVVHDLNHIGQIAKAMAFQFGEHVGPWHEHTSILRK